MGDPAEPSKVGISMKVFEKAAEHIHCFLSKYKYPCLILLLGLLLMLLPGRRNAGKAEDQAAAPPVGNAVANFSAQNYCAQTEQDLEQILTQIEGAGKVRVLLTLQAGQETVYLKDDETQRSLDGEKTVESSSGNTVILSRGASYNEAVIVKTKYPSFRGALIVSQGGDDPVVRIRLVEAVSALLGLGSDKITVVKMK